MVVSLSMNKAKHFLLTSEIIQLVLVMLNAQSFREAVCNGTASSSVSFNFISEIKRGSELKNQ